MTYDEVASLRIVIDAYAAERTRLIAERDRARGLAAALMDEDRARGFDVFGHITTHDRDSCQGRGCPVHHASDHHMRDWPANWRGDRGLMERVCVHGVGHVDPDDATFRASRGDTDTLHGCDGCCHPS